MQNQNKTKKNFLPATSYKLVALILLIVLAVTSTLSIRLYAVSGASMEPTFQDSAHLVVDKLFWYVGIKRGDILVFTNPHQTSQIDVKRVIALPNETVKVDDNSVTIVRADKSEEVFPERSKIGREGNGTQYEMHLGAEDYFMMGDNRRASTDSRNFGAVQPVNIIGRIVWSF